MKPPSPHELLRRLADDDAVASGPISYNKNDHSVEATISMGSPVQREYGTEILRIAPDAVDLTRLNDGGIPLLDHHKQDGINSILGRAVDMWFERGALVGRFKFNETPEGRKAKGMVARGELAGVSAGYRVDQWEITNADGDVVDPDKDRLRWDDDLTFTATRWALFEASLVGVPADTSASIRSLGGGYDPVIADIKARMLCRVRANTRQRMYERMSRRDDE
jgi:phage head maturation protease